MVRVRPIGHKTKEVGYCCGYATPIQGKFKVGYDPFIEGEKLCRINNGDLVIKSGNYAWEWDGQPVYESWYY